MNKPYGGFSKSVFANTLPAYAMMVDEPSVQRVEPKDNDFTPNPVDCSDFKQPVNSYQKKQRKRKVKRKGGE